MSVNVNVSPAHSIRVIVAEDTEYLRSLLVHLIDRDPRFKVVGQAADGHVALDVVATTPADVLLLDLSMPVVDGMQVLSKVSAVINVVIITGYSVSDVAEECHKSGARGFVEKGTPIPQLLDALVDATL